MFFILIFSLIMLISLLVCFNLFASYKKGIFFRFISEFLIKKKKNGIKKNLPLKIQQQTTFSNFQTSIKNLQNI